MHANREKDERGVRMFCGWRGFSMGLVVSLAAVGSAQPVQWPVCSSQTRASRITVSGTVSDATGARVTSASVRIGCESHIQQARTDASGHFTLIVPDGEYHFEVQAAGFALFTKTLDVSGNASNADVTLAVQNASNTVTVQAEAGYMASESTVGTKTETPLLETPQSIFVITRDQMDAQATSSLSTVLLYTSGVAAQTQGYQPSRDWSIYLRGFNATTYGLFHNGLFWDSYAQTDSFELEQVEILKGPSSVLYGENTPGGLINMVTKKPVLSPLRKLELGYGSYDRVQFTGDLGGPIDAAKHWSYRAPILYRHSGTQIDHIPDNRFLVAPSLRWSPTSSTMLTLLTDYQYDHTGWIQFMPGYGTLFSNPNGQIPTHLDLGQPDWDKTIRRQFSVGYEFTQLIGKNWSFHQNLRELLAKSDTRFTYYSDGSATGDGFVDAAMTTIVRYPWEYYPNDNTFTIDNQLEAKFGSGHLQQTLLAGVDLIRYASPITYTSSDQNGGNGVLLNIFHPVYGPVVLPTEYTRERAYQRQVGAYLQDQIKLDQHWIVLLSGRNDWVQNTTTYYAGTPASQPDHHLSGRAGLLYVSNSGFAPYFSYSQSFVPTLGTNFYGQPYKPTTATQYEGGIKYQPRNARYLVTLSGFNIAETNVQTTDPANPLNTIQTGEERSRGAELEVKANPIRDFNLTASFSYDPVKITRTTIPSLLGTSPVATPRYLASLWGDYTLRGLAVSGLGFGAGVRTTSTTYGGQGDDVHPTINVPSYTLFDGALHYDFGKKDREQWRVAINGSNLADKKYVPACSGITNCYYGYRRALNGSLRFMW